MPTRGRPQFVKEAVACWMRQTYPRRELIVVDDRDSPSFPHGLQLEGAQYHLLDRRLSIGAKRNIACARSAGEVILHWDDDDWSAPSRIEDQVTRLQRTGKLFTGYHSGVFVDEERSEAWRYSAAPTYAFGSSFCYRRSLWQRCPFADRNTGEDNEFVARNRSDLISVDAGELMVARIHGGNTSSKRENRNNLQWTRCEWPSFMEVAVEA